MFSILRNDVVFKPDPLRSLALVALVVRDEEKDEEEEEEERRTKEKKKI